MEFLYKYKHEIKKKITKFDNISIIHGGGWKKLEIKKFLNQILNYL